LAKSSKRSIRTSKNEAPAVDEIPIEEAVILDGESDAEPDNTVEPLQAAPADEIPTQEPESASSGFMPLLFGGILAGAVGFGAAYLFITPRSTVLLDEALVTIEDQSAELSLIKEQLESLQSAQADSPSMAQVADISNEIEDVSSLLEGQIRVSAEESAARIEVFSTRLDALEKRPGIDGTLADSAIAGYERELDQLRADVEAQRAEMQQLLTTANQTLSETRETAAEYEQNANAAAEFATRRGALVKIEAAIESGRPFADLLAEFGQSSETPTALSALANTGVATKSELLETFTVAARTALATARREGVAGEETGGIGAFLRNQFEVRSVEARAGADADAILSRAQAAMTDGRIIDALAEVQSLPEVARAEMSAWAITAENRVQVLAAIDTLAQTLNQN